MQNLFFKSYDALSDVRVFGNNVYLYQSDGKEYLHAIVDAKTADLIQWFYDEPSFDEEMTIEIVRTLYAKSEFVNHGSKPVSDNIWYANGKGAGDLMVIRSMMKGGQKIHAIKHMRGLFNRTMGLKEAKELLEILCQ